MTTIRQLFDQWDARLDRLLDPAADVPDGFYQVGPPGLYIRVRGGSRCWTTRWGNPTRWMSLGSVVEVNLIEADRAHTVAQGMIAKGIDPGGVAMSFREAARDYIRAHESDWTDERYAITLRRLLERHVHPVIGDRAVHAVRADHVERVLQGIEAPSTRLKAQAIIRKVIRWARAP